jgi:Amt family ammonium transporter
VVYPFHEGIIWNGNYGFQAWLEQTTGASFHDFAGSVVVHGMGGISGLVAMNSLKAMVGGIMVREKYPWVYS